MRFGVMDVHEYMRLPKERRDAFDEWMRAEGWIDVDETESPVGPGCRAIRLGEGYVDAECMVIPSAHDRGRDFAYEWRRVPVSAPPPNVWAP